MLYDFLNQYKVVDGKLHSKPGSILFFLTHILVKLKVLLYQSLR